MVDFSILPAFLAVILVFLLPPGPDMTYMLAVGLQGGPWAAIKAIMGIGTGMSVYAIAAVVGLAKIASDYPTVMIVIKVVGAGYMVWLGTNAVRGSRVEEPGKGADVTITRFWYGKGVLVSLTNPKLLLFFAAVLPRFTGSAQNITAQLTLLGAVNVSAEVILYGFIGVCAGCLNARFASNSRLQRVLQYFAAAVYFGLAVFICLDLIREICELAAHPSNR